MILEDQFWMIFWPTRTHVEISNELILNQADFTRTK